MSKIKVTLLKSPIACKPDQVATVKALGLKKIRSQVIHEDTPDIKGMIFKVKHMVNVENIVE